MSLTDTTELLTASRPSAPLDPSLLVWGEVTAEAELPLIAAEAGTLKATITLKQAVPAGHFVEFWKHFVSDSRDLQADSPDQPCYLAAQCSAGDCRPVVYPNAPVHGPGAYFPYRKWGGAQLLADAGPGDTVTFLVKDTEMQSFEDVQFNLRIALLDAEQNLVGYFGDACYPIAGGPRDHFYVVAPTIVAPGERWDCQVIARDRFRNRSSDRVRPADLQIDAAGVEWDEIIEDPDYGRLTVRGLRTAEEGIVYLDVTDGTIRGRSNPIVVQRDPKLRVFWGDIHQHACYADGRAVPAESYDYGRNVACLDFGAVAPHVTLMFQQPMVYIDAAVQNGWEELRAATQAANAEGFPALFGCECHVRRHVGDMNEYFKDYSVVPPEAKLGHNPESYEAFLDVFHNTPGEKLLLPHAHAGGGPGKHALPEVAEQTNVEIVSIHGIFEEFYDQWLSHGRRVGVHGAGDTHMQAMGNASPGAHYVNTNGLTAARAPANMHDDIWAAFRDRGTWAVTGNQRIFLDFTVNGHAMGSEVKGESQPRTVRLVGAGTQPVVRIDIVKNSEPVYTWRPELTRREVLRVMWHDTWNERRADDSMTTGELRTETGLRLLRHLNAWNVIDTFVQEGDAVRFRTAAHSHVARGVLVEPGGADILDVSACDQWRGAETLKCEFRLDLSARGAERRQELELPGGRGPQKFNRKPRMPEFVVRADWVQTDWPLTAELQWEDPAPAAGDYYYVRLEQLDGSLAWSSPIWFD